MQCLAALLQALTQISAPYACASVQLPGTKSQNFAVNPNTYLVRCRPRLLFSLLWSPGGPMLLPLRLSEETWLPAQSRVSLDAAYG
jgi:hypothetical protein